MTTLCYVGASVLADLKDKVQDHADRYLATGFADMSTDMDWNFRTKFRLDSAPLGELLPGTGCEIELGNSLLVLRALPDLTPAAATEARIWTRLSHVECLEFCRERWLTGKSGETLLKAIRAHFFGDSRTRARDDHPIGRLWWNGFIARRVAEVAPDLQVEDVLGVLLARADIRLNTIERPGVMMMPRLTAAIVRCIRDTPVLVENEDAFRNFMKSLNARGGGRPFEVPAVDEGSVKRFVESCVPDSQELGV